MLTINKLISCSPVDYAAEDYVDDWGYSNKRWHVQKACIDKSYTWTIGDTAIEGVVFLENLHGVSPTAKQAIDGLKKSAPHWATLMMEE